MDPRDEARRRLANHLAGAYDVRVLEPSPPAVTEAPWLADDPVAIGPRDGRPIVAPVTGADHTWDELSRADDDLRAWCADRWLGGWRRLAPMPDPSRYAATRGAWHTLAEHVLAPARHAATGKIGLRFTRSGFGTPFFRDQRGTEMQVRVEGADLVVEQDARTRRETVTTMGRAAALVGRPPGAPTEVYEPTTRLAPDAELALDEASARLLGDWFGFAASVLEQLRAESSADERAATRLQLWPEHFDASIDLGDAGSGTRGTFGASPGDDDHPEPYLYVTHWSARPPDPYWNDDTFGGASLTFRELVGADDQRAAALAFLREGRRILTGR